MHRFSSSAHSNHFKLHNLTLTLTIENSAEINISGDATHRQLKRNTDTICMRYYSRSINTHIDEKRGTIIRF